MPPEAEKKPKKRKKKKKAESNCGCCVLSAVVIRLTCTVSIYVLFACKSLVFVF
jgi:hypothetical protein